MGIRHKMVKIFGGYYIEGNDTYWYTGSIKDFIDKYVYKISTWIELKWLRLRIRYGKIKIKLMEYYGK